MSITWTDNDITALLDDCRLELQITWNDDDTNARIVNHIKNALRFINKKTGAKMSDFMAGGKANALFLAYVRRAHSGDISKFEEDYLSDIIGLQTEFEVENYVE